MPRLTEGSSLSEHRAAMEERVLDAWQEALGEKGYGDVTLADVAARVGIARSAIYRYAPDKLTLLRRLVDREVQQFVHDVTARLATARTPERKLEILVEQQLEYVAAQRLTAHDMASALSPDDHRSVVAHLAPVHDLLAQVLREGVRAKAFRRMDLDVAVELVTSTLAAHRTDLVQGTVDTRRVSKETVAFVLGAVSVRARR